MKIRFKKLHPNAKPPTRAKEGDAGWDLTCTHIEAKGSGLFLFHTGIAVEIPPGYFGLIRPRSSVCNTIYQFASSGVIDSGYRGELIVPMRFMHGSEWANTYNLGDRISQLLILPLPEVTFKEAETLSETDRGNGGFGSTGK